MNKTLISLAIATGMAVSGAALAEAPTVYGNVHLSIDDLDTGATDDEIQMSSRTSSFGMKGTEDLGDGMKSLYKVEFQIDPSNTTTTISTRDQWVGLKGGMGTVKFGTFSSNYKQMGGKIDPMYRTGLEGRGFLNIQSSFHSGSGRAGGRMTEAVQYSSPKMGGMQMVFNTGFARDQTAGGTNIDETIGLGLRYATKSFTAYFDYLEMSFEGATTTTVDSESMMKVGGKFKAGAVTIGAQFESAEDLEGSDYVFLNANYKMNANTNVSVSAGTRSDDIGTVADDGTTGVAVLYNHKLGKMTNVYAGYGSLMEDATGVDDTSLLTFGVRKKF
jgi:predicted porin